MSQQPVEKSMGPVEAIVEALKIVTPGLSLSKILGEMGQEAQRMGVQGSAELASMLFTGASYVPYGRGQNPADTGIEGEEVKRDEPSLGREM